LVSIGQLFFATRVSAQFAFSVSCDLNLLPIDILLNVFLAIAVDNLGDIDEADDRDNKASNSPKIDSSAKNSIVCDVKVCVCLEKCVTLWLVLLIEYYERYSYY
jgi:hypothetical protein